MHELTVRRLDASPSPAEKDVGILVDASSETHRNSLPLGSATKHTIWILFEYRIGKGMKFSGQWLVQTFGSVRGKSH